MKLAAGEIITIDGTAFRKIAAGWYRRDELEAGRCIDIRRENRSGQPWQSYKNGRHEGSYQSLSDAMYHNRRS